MLPTAPICARCGIQMQLFQTIPPTGLAPIAELPKVYIFKCKTCGAMSPIEC